MLMVFYSSGKICKTGGAGGGGGGGAAAANTTTAAAADDPPKTTAAPAPAPGGGGAGGGAAAGGDCSEIKAGSEVEVDEFGIAEAALGAPPAIAEPAAGACIVAGYGDKPEAQSKASGDCTVDGEAITITLAKGEVCPGDSGGAILDKDGKLIGIIKATAACGKTGKGMKAQTIATKAAGGDSVTDGEAGGGKTEAGGGGGGTSIITASIILIASAEIMVILCGQNLRI